jgi:hemerythrin-like domain-containing protein
MEQLFKRLKSAREDRQALLVEVAARLAAHSHAEEMKVYPALAQAAPQEHGEVQHGSQEHHEAEQMLHLLMAMEPEDRSFDEALDRFVEAVLHHVQEEETELLPALQQAVDAATLKELGQQFEEIRTKELEIAGIPAEAG